MPEYRGGVIGCGWFARNHLHGWRETPGVTIAAVCDSAPARADTFAREFGVARTYTDANAMLSAEHLDFVDIVTQPASHRALVEAAASAGIATICQKPLAPTLEDAAAMVRVCATAQMPFMVHENFRWQTPMRELKAAASNIGELFWGRISFRTPYDVYANQPYLATDPRFIIADLGVHLLDLARFFFGEVQTLTAQTQRVNPKIKGEDAATVLLKMASGAVCLVDCSYASQAEEDLFPQTLVHLEGTQGTAILGPHYALTTVTQEGTTHRNVGPKSYAWSAPPGDAVQDSVVAIQKHWIECLASGQMPETSGADNLKTLVLVETAYLSAAHSETIRLADTA